MAKLETMTITTSNGDVLINVSDYDEKTMTKAGAKPKAKAKAKPKAKKK
jgi:hypothetical protein